MEAGEAWGAASCPGEQGCLPLTPSGLSKENSMQNPNLTFRAFITLG